MTSFPSPRVLAATGAMMLLAGAMTFSGPAAMNPSKFEIHRGVNLSHWLSQTQGWPPKETFITEQDFRFIDSIGYDHVRIPVDEAELWDEQGRPIEATFSLLTRGLDWCAKYHLRAIVDLHILRAHYFNAANEGQSISLWTDEKAQDNFLGLWIELSARLRQYPDSMVAYELMNEPVAENPEDWNRLVERGVKRLRMLEPRRVLVIGSNRWQIPGTFPELRVPAGDPNIILSMHTYSPIVFTHHLADWVPFRSYTGPVHYPGQVVSESDLEKVAAKDSALARAMSGVEETWNRQRLEEEMLPAVNKAAELGLQLFCGEFGCLPHVDRQERLAYYRDLISAFRDHHIAFCNWEYKGDFGIYTFDFNRRISLGPDDELIHLLTAK